MFDGWSGGIIIKVSIKNLPQEERPREKLISLGKEKLTNQELIAILLRVGSRKESALDLSNRILTRAGSVSALGSISLEELIEIEGIKEAKAAQLLAAIELGRQILKQDAVAAFKVNSPGDVYNIMHPDMKTLKKEIFKILLLNTKNNIIGEEMISMGSLNSSIVHPREVFTGAIRKSAASIVLVHNHPSGNPSPSREDMDITKRLAKVGEIVGIEVLDHIIVAGNEFFSFKENNLF